MKSLVTICCVFLFGGDLIAEVVPLSWETKYAAPVQIVSGEAHQLLPAFRLGVEKLPESVIVKLALSQPALLGLTPAQSATLAPLVAKRYELIEASTEYAKVHSLLPYCYSDKRATQGAALMRIPESTDSKSPVIIFLHGYGGSFIWYLHWLSEALPDHIIIAPAYGINPTEPPIAYLLESLDAASRRLGHPLVKPTLVGLSAGGFGACRAFLKEPEKFERLVCLAAYPPVDSVRRFRPNQSVHFIAGSLEPFVRSGELGASLQTIRKTCPTAGMTLVDGADHFFLLSHPDVARKSLDSALKGTVKETKTR